MATKKRIKKRVENIIAEKGESWVKHLIASIDDKAGIIIALTILCLGGMYAELEGIDGIISHVITGFLGLAVGKKVS